MSLTISSTDFRLPQAIGTVYHGKVRDTYNIANKYLVAVATDRISAFDVILPQAIPYKGQVLNQVAQYFLEQTTDIVPNWLLKVPSPTVSIGLLCQPFKIEMVIRGALIGSAWRLYQSGQRQLCGNKLPEGLQEYDLFEKPLITPTTKADAGHDQDIAAEDIVEQGLATKEEFAKLSMLAQALFKRGQQMAAQRGLFLADTKYEFGRLDNQIYLIDEIHTPDSSRYFYNDSYQKYLKDRSSAKPKHLSKEFVREWLMANGFQGKTGQKIPTMSDQFVDDISQHYIELYEQLTGLSFDKKGQLSQAQLESAIKDALEELR
jgi:phosphoribosylaminoimidazole-succinocarboxamide synthase